MNTINHTEALAFINSVEHVAHRCVTDELDEIDATQLILATIEVVLDNADEWVSTLELAITKGGYEIRYTPAESVAGMDLDSIVMDLLERGLEVQREMLLED